MNNNIDLKEYINEWEIYDPNKNLEIALVLSKSIQEKNIQGIIEIFRDMKALRSLIVWRGENGECLKLIAVGLKEIISQKNDLKIDIENGKEIIEFLRELKIPEESLLFCVNAAYHLRDKENLDVFLGIIFKNVEILIDKRIYFRVLHILASWKEAVEHNSKESIKLNMEVVANTKESDPVYYIKAKFGLSYSKPLAPRQKVEDFLYFAKEFKKYGNIHDSFRATAEASRAMLDLSKQQGIEDIAFGNIEKSKEIALIALKIAKDVGYPNLEIIASDILSAIYLERLKKLDLMGNKIKNTRNISKEYKQRYNIFSKIFKGDDKKSESFKKRAEELRKIYKYETIFNKQYNEAHFNHI